MAGILSPAPIPMSTAVHQNGPCDHDLLEPLRSRSHVSTTRHHHFKTSPQDQESTTQHGIVCSPHEASRRVSTRQRASQDCALAHSAAGMLTTYWQGSEQHSAVTGSPGHEEPFCWATSNMKSDQGPIPRHESLPRTVSQTKLSHP
jgi:hypothetical protein